MRDARAGVVLLFVLDVDDLRFSRIAELVIPDGRRGFRAISVFPDGRTGEGQPSIDELLRDPPRCLYLYEGLACSAWRAPGETYASQCVALRERLNAEPVLQGSARVRLYDSKSAGERPLSVPRAVFRLSLAR